MIVSLVSSVSSYKVRLRHLAQTGSESVDKHLQSVRSSHETCEYCHGSKTDSSLDQKSEIIALRHVPLAHRSGR